MTDDFKNILQDLKRNTRNHKTFKTESIANNLTFKLLTTFNYLRRLNFGCFQPSAFKIIDRLFFLITLILLATSSFVQSLWIHKLKIILYFIHTQYVHTNQNFTINESRKKWNYVSRLNKTQTIELFQNFLLTSEWICQKQSMLCYLVKRNKTVK